MSTIIRTSLAVICFVACIGSLAYVAAGAAGLPVPPVRFAESFGGVIFSAALWLATLITGMCLAAGTD